MRRFADPESDSQPLRLLLLEDSKLDARIIVAELEQSALTFEVTRVETRGRFLEALRSHAFDLILSDYNVPGFAGEEALALAVEHCPQTPFLFVSGSLGEHTAIDLLKRGATDYVLKDRLERLVPSVQRALRENREKLERRRAEETLRERVEFEQQLIGIVSHDLRNPLNAITLGASVLLKREGLNEASTTSVRRILASAERAGRMIRDLLDFTQARLGEGLPITPREVELHSLAEQVVDEFEHSHPEREIVLSSCNAQQTLGEWDPDRVAQALTNLVSNALAYSPKDSPVTLRCFGDAQQGGFEVHNFGPPIAADRIPHIFKPLSRGVTGVGLQTRSIGLGLFIVESIARAHRGSITVRSTEGEGTTFTLSLPRQSEGARIHETPAA